MRYVKRSSTNSIIQEAEKAARELIQNTAEQMASSVPVAEAPVPVITPQVENAQYTAMDVDSHAQHSESSGKRKAEEELVPQEAKKAHVGKSGDLLEISYYL